MNTIDYSDVTPEVVREIVFWGLQWDERLTHEDLDEAIEAELDGWLPAKYRDDQAIAIEMHGYVRMRVPLSMPRTDWMLDNALEQLDEEFGDPDGNATYPSDAMEAAAAEFAAKIRGEYRPWMCEDVLAVKVPVRAWVQQHNPEWLTEDQRPGEAARA